LSNAVFAFPHVVGNSDVHELPHAFTAGHPLDHALNVPRGTLLGNRQEMNLSSSKLSFCNPELLE
jgi:hypothetical protein